MNPKKPTLTLNLDGETENSKQFGNIHVSTQWDLEYSSSKSEDEESKIKSSGIAR